MQFRQKDYLCDVLQAPESDGNDRGRTDRDHALAVRGGRAAHAAALRAPGRTLRRAAAAALRVARGGAARCAAGRPHRRNADPGVVRRPLGPQGVDRGCGRRCRGARKRRGRGAGARGARTGAPGRGRLRDAHLVGGPHGGPEPVSESGIRGGGDLGLHP